MIGIPFLVRGRSPSHECVPVCWVAALEVSRPSRAPAVQRTGQEARPVTLRGALSAASGFTTIHEIGRFPRETSPKFAASARGLALEAIGMACADRPGAVGVLAGA